METYTKGCNACPLRGSDDLGMFCNHPEDPNRDIPYKMELPVWCLLKRESLLIILKTDSDEH